MIPIKISLRNFMPYRDLQTLDFTGIHTASICGENGSGKSAIIDAITWVLWGETRTRHDDDLIHQGQQEVEVDFEFAVGEQKYRALRKRSRPKKVGGAGQSALHLYMDSNGSYRPIDGDTISLTQEKIKKILHMDYGTFINSAYLRQGHADEFTTANPTERKKVLASILELNLYDDLGERARELARRSSAKKEELTRNLKDINAELEQLPLCENELRQAQDDLGVLDEGIVQHDTRLATLRRQKETLEAKRAQLGQIEASVSQKSKTLSQVEAQVKQAHKRIKEYETVLVQREEIETGYACFTDARDQNEALNRNLAMLNRLNERKHSLEMAISQLSQNLNKEHAQTQSRVVEMEKNAGSLQALREDLSNSQKHRQQIAQKEEALKQKRQTAQELLVLIRNLEAEWRRLEREIKEIADKLRLLKTEKSARCPLCGCELGEGGIKHIESEFANQRQNNDEEIKANRSEAQIRQQELKLLTEQCGVEERELTQEQGALLGHIGALEKDIDRGEEAGRDVTAERKKLHQIEEQLATRDFAAAELSQLKQVEESIAGLNYDFQRHEQVRQVCDAYKKYEASRQKLDEASRLIARERGDAARFESLAQDLQAGLLADSSKRQELTAEIKMLPALVSDLQVAEKEMKDLTARLKQSQERLGSIKGRLEYLRSLTVKKTELEAQFIQVVRDEQIYRELTEAFGKKGVQALIIETTLPEIENEANHLLARMTDNRMNVKIEPLKETQKGDQVETLDIKISDELGTRNYELFSGGEAFRINFAIRIALSKLLARRHGAPLPTLIIDEGFGTQDSQGIEKLREAITTIQDDFKKILVITHIEELRDAFPARIDVIKEADGSKIILS